MAPYQDLETIAKDSKQTWLQTHAEVWTNIVIGFMIATVGNWVYLWWFGIVLDLRTITGLGIFMTGLSIIRQLIVRRTFEQIRIKRWLRLKADQNLER